ncbi:RNA polymerase II-associated protein 1 [Fasciolopsis buskii]|uniref:RNA polymerase II-associated protein 1 n=1 Tax=Fasciolopsis buskii TaxID=27845 RepID=A0A8E0RQE5_9TREM|nr:RNA polymerase II-associated protein 1 [Fasciolopsis buski]
MKGGASLPKEKRSSEVFKMTSGANPLKFDSKSPHMDTLEEEKLAWTKDLPEVAKRPPSVNLANDEFSFELDTKRLDTHIDSATSKNSAPCQARFDLNGFVVPPEAVLDVHLGLHHHGEEPERAGYTVGEIFHLARSGVPAQRRLALATLASSLAQSRRGRHVPHLAPFYAPSLINGLLDTQESSLQSDERSGGGGGGGIAFLLRWCLDEAVSVLTSVSTAAAGISDTGTAAGISLVLLVECIRGFANLLSDSLGEAYLARSFVWSCDLLPNTYWTPSMMSAKLQKTVPGVTVRTRNFDSEKEIDHAKAMRQDPIRFLFTEGHLARRLAWLLADGMGRPRARLSADAVGLWLPALLIRAVRHSATLAYKIFSTSELYVTLRDNFLPETEPHSSHGVSQSRSMRLSDAYNVPLPSVLQLFRITMMSSDSIRLAMVNDLHIVERCLSYVSCAGCAHQETASSISSLITHLPSRLPVCVAFQLYLEALRCLTAVLRPSNSNTRDCVPILALSLLRKHGSTLVSSGLRCYSFYRMLCDSGIDFCNDNPADANTHFVLPLLAAWIAFLVEAFEQIVGSSGNESVLTGAPAKLADVDIVTIPVWDIASDAKDQHAASPVDWELLPSTSPIDVSLLEPVTLASTNVPDLGTAVCFRYRVSERNLGSFWWPKSGGGSVSSSASSLGDPSRASDECDPLALNLTLPIARIQPILVALLKCMQFFLLHWRFHLAHRESVQDVFHAVQPIVNWIKCLATRPLFPWLRAVDRIRVPLPHWLVAVECQIAGEMLLLCGQLLSQQGDLTNKLMGELFDGSSGNPIHQATLRLLPYLRENQLQLMNSLLAEVVFSPVSLKWTNKLVLIY